MPYWRKEGEAGRHVTNLSLPYNQHLQQTGNEAWSGVISSGIEDEYTGRVTRIVYGKCRQMYLARI